ncbi:transcription initiation factor TFIID subunit 12 isoform X2 [Gambusia affinis]|uniref:transcription initiation factor TFIID subunit 12 isoform X2 n=1 Tax=Gambusia affinis TaxID=33528 RepID=UPI001CDD101D|nr:transcription initiation factor TFIID subunit 12 isoform X2 [Gambusia affinis]
MKVQLLLLLALAGPLCSFTRASPTTVTSYYSLVTKETEETIVTGPSPTDPQVAPQDVVLSTTEKEANTDVPTTESNQILDTTTVEVTGAPTVHTSASAETTSPPPETTAAPAFETSVPEETSSPFIHETVAPITSADATAGTDNGSAGVTVETEESLSTGQIVGIVIGAIVAVVIVIAVVIAVLRRMGKYSP